MQTMTLCHADNVMQMGQHDYMYMSYSTSTATFREHTETLYQLTTATRGEFLCTINTTNATTTTNANTPPLMHNCDSFELHGGCKNNTLKGPRPGRRARPRRAAIQQIAQIMHMHPPAAGGYPIASWPFLAARARTRVHTKAGAMRL